MASDYLTVYFNEKPVLVLNGRLLEKQKAWDNLDEIKSTHIKRLLIEEKMKNTDNPSELKELFEDWTDYQFVLQSLWGFKLCANFHKFWEVPKCKCPVMDNKDRYPISRVINQECPVHGIDVDTEDKV